MENNIEIECLKNELRSKFVEWQDKNRIIISNGNKLFMCDKSFTEISLIGEFPTNIIVKFLTNFFLLRRLLRYYYYNVIPIDNKRIFVTFRKSIGIFENGKFFRIRGLLKPARVLRNACAHDKHGGLYFGEYNSNPSREKVNIYYLPPQSTKLEVIYTFVKNTVRHIHGIYKDPFSDTFWVLTGDIKTECKILKTSDHFNTLEEVGSGNENWRAVSMQFSKNYIYFATDAEYSSNYIFEMDRKTYKTKIISEIDGPVYYSTKIKDQIIFAVTAEGCPSQKENKAVLWKLDTKNKVSCVKSFNKDIFPIQLMPGTIHFANGIIDDHIYAYGIGLRNLNHTSIKIKL